MIGFRQSLTTNSMPKATGKSGRSFCILRPAFPSLCNAALSNLRKLLIGMFLAKVSVKEEVGKTKGSYANKKAKHNGSEPRWQPARVRRNESGTTPEHFGQGRPFPPLKVTTQ